MEGISVTQLSRYLGGSDPSVAAKFYSSKIRSKIRSKMEKYQKPPSMDFYISNDWCTSLVSILIPTACEVSDRMLCVQVVCRSIFS